MSSSEVIDIIPAVANNSDNTEIVRILNLVLESCTSINNTLVAVAGLILLLCLLYVTFRFF